MLTTRPVRDRRPADRRGDRKGVVTIEVLGVMPCLIIFAVSIAEFSMAMRLNHKVAFSSRYGAKLASEQPRFGGLHLGTFNAPDTADNLKARIDAWLMSAGLTPSAAVLLEHNACGVSRPHQLQVAPGMTIDDVDTLPALPAADGVQNVNYVRVTVWLPVVGNVPNALQRFGLDWTGALLRHSTVFRLEADNAPPMPVISVPPNQLPAGYAVASSPAGSTGEPIRIVTDRTGRMTLTLSGRSSRDAETNASRLKYRWSATTGAVGPNDQSQFRTEINVPATGGVMNLKAVLDVTDDCGCSSKLMVPVEVRQGDSLPLAPLADPLNGATP